MTPANRNQKSALLMVWLGGQAQSLVHSTERNSSDNLKTAGYTHSLTLVARYKKKTRKNGNMLQAAAVVVQIEIDISVHRIF